MTARFLSAYLQPCVGEIFDLKVTGISTAGVFAQIENMGAEGLIPLTSMPADYYEIPDGNLEIIGINRGLRLRMGEMFKGRLAEASPITGGLIFKFIDPEEGEDYFARGCYKSGYTLPDRNSKRQQMKQRKAAAKERRQKRREAKKALKEAKAKEAAENITE